MIKPKLKYLITGTGHCGTGFIARTLTEAGIICGHENLFSLDKTMQENLSGIGPWGYNWKDVQAESSWPACMSLDHQLLEDVTVIHLVRNPLNVLASICSSGVGLHYAIMRYLACVNYIESARQRVLLCHVESDDEIRSMFGIKSVYYNKAYNTHNNTRLHFTWDNVLKLPGGNLVKRFAVMYGY